MNCKQVQEHFPEICENPEHYPELMRHMESCGECRDLFELYKKLQIHSVPVLSEEKSAYNRSNIYKKMFRHDLFLAARRVTAAAALILLVLFSVFPGTFSSRPSLADIPDDVLWMESQSDLVPEPGIDEESMIEYLANNAYIEELGELY